jgi:hypothetical protein
MEAYLIKLQNIQPVLGHVNFRFAHLKRSLRNPVTLQLSDKLPKACAGTAHNVERSAAKVQQISNLSNVPIRSRRSGDENHKLVEADIIYY